MSGNKHTPTLLSKLANFLRSESGIVHISLLVGIQLFSFLTNFLDVSLYLAIMASLTLIQTLNFDYVMFLPPHYNYFHLFYL